jgi:hypothetical protein
MLDRNDPFAQFATLSRSVRLATNSFVSKSVSKMVVARSGLSGAISVRDTGELANPWRDQGLDYSASFG